MRKSRFTPYFLPAFCAVLIGAPLLFTPLPSLLDRLMPDDAFYYFQTARVFARTGFSSFDGLHATNGYQPLWFLVCAAVYRFFPNGGEVPIRILLSIQIAFYAGASVLLFRLLTRLAGQTASLIALTVWFASTPHIAFMGLETALQMFMLALTMNAWMAFRRPTRKSALALGASAGLLFLARTDMAIIVAFLSLAAFMVGRVSDPTLKKNLLFAAPLAILAGAYLLTNLIFFGHLMPVSGAAKLFYSGQGRHAAASAIGFGPAIVQNLAWAFDVNHRVILAGLIGPPLILSLARRNRLHPFAALWPFYAGAIILYLFYATAFFGQFTQTAWYYSPQIMMAALTAAIIPDALDPHRRLSEPCRALIALLLPALILSWGIRLYFLPPLLSIAAFWGISAVRLFNLSSFARMLLLLSLAAAIGFFAFFFSMRGVANPHAFLFAIALYILFSAALLPNPTGHLLARYAPALLLSCVALLTCLRINQLVSREPSGWNHNLYTGAIWARDHLPPEATIWSDSTGILGYFSNHTCVNTDGLINSYDYLENVLKAGRKREYLLKWDYSIDAMSDDSLLSIFPTGAFIDLPPQFNGTAFQDGTLTRQIKVFQMPAR